MNDRQLSLFLSVAEQGSFNKAEGLEHLSRQAIIAQINALEREVGVPLFRRTSQGVCLTRAGTEYYGGIRRIMLDYGELLARTRAQEEAPQLRLASVEHHVLLQPVVKAYRALYPQVEVVSGFFPQLDEVELVREDRIDVGETPHSAAKEMRGLDYITIYEAPYWCVMRGDHPLAARQRIAMDALDGQRVVLSENRNGSMYSGELLREISAHAQVEIRSSRRMRRVSVVYEACDSGAVYISASPFLRQLTDCVIVPLDSACFREYGVVFRKKPSPAVRNFIDLASGFYRERA